MYSVVRRTSEEINQKMVNSDREHHLRRHRNDLLIKDLCLDKDVEHQVKRMNRPIRHQ